MTRLLVGAAAASVLLMTGGCAADTEEPTGSTPQASSDVPSAAASDPTARTTSSAVSYPVPPGAEGWPVRDIASCSDLGTVTEPELVVRVPVATPDCVVYPEDSDVLVIATGDVQATVGEEEEVEVPGFDGEVRSIRAPISRGVALVAEPAGQDVKYLILWDGETDSTITQILQDLFSTP